MDPFEYPLESPFEVGKVYNRRRDINGRFGGQQQGGMSTPAAHPFIFLFTGQEGEKHGYRDEPRPDGTFWYTGEGQEGDMAFVRSNRALRDHRADGKRVYLFESLGGGSVRHIGEVEYLGHHREERPDSGGALRSAIVFELALDPGAGRSAAQGVREPGAEPLIRTKAQKSMFDLRRLALEGARRGASPQERRRIVHLRSDAVREYVLTRAGGVCEGCHQPAPFKTKRGRPYLEPHHTTRMADGGPDHPAHVIALCPTCHRRVHHARDGAEYNAALQEWLAERESR